MAEGAERLPPAELAAAAEALVPYCAPGAALHDEYGSAVLRGLVAAGRQHVGDLRWVGSCRGLGWVCIAAVCVLRYKLACALPGGPPQQLGLVESFLSPTPFTPLAVLFSTCHPSSHQLLLCLLMQATSSAARRPLLQPCTSSSRTTGPTPACRCCAR